VSSACAALSRSAQLNTHTPHHLPHVANTLLQCSISHQLLPKNEQTKPEDVRPLQHSPVHLPFNCLHIHQDVPYLSPIIKEIESERRERMDLDAMVIKK
jgi:hypothetical protein